jgi:hypothetical protein
MMDKQDGSIKGMRVNARDMRISDELNRMKLLTVKQIGALYFVEPPRFSWDADKSAASVRRRISILKRHGYLRSAYVPGDTPEKCYFLGPAAVGLLKADEEARVNEPRYAEKKETYALNSARHDLPLNSFIINLMLLDRIRDDFMLAEFRGEQEMNFKMPPDRIEFKPDGYLRGGLKGRERACFFELHRGAVNASRVESKLLGHAEFIKRGMREMLAIRYDPVYCWLVPDMDRLVKVAACIRSFKIKYRQAYGWLNGGFYYLATDEDMEIRSLDRGSLSENPLHNRFWYDENLARYKSPFRIEERQGSS